MLVLLPPSETKRPGGEGAPLDLDGLALPSLRPARESVLDALIALSSDEEEAARVLKISAKRRHEVADNAALRTSPTLPAIDRYTGVLFDALDAGSLEARARSWLGDHVMIHSAPLGPVAALDGIPAYRLAAGTSVPGIPSLRRIWAGAVSEAWEALRPDFVLDLRSEAYAALGPLPAGVSSAFVRVMSEDSGGQARALNHFNKHAKGDLVRSFASEGVELSSLGDFRDWASDAGWDVRDRDEGGQVALIV